MNIKDELKEVFCLNSVIYIVYNK